MDFEWDPEKAAGNLRKHEVRFAEAVTVFEDDAMLTMHDEHPDEDRFAAIGISSLGRILVVIYTAPGDRIRIISARKAAPMERAQYEGVIK
ncbi:MAG: BrnT family toxin [Candidatus Binataceae bacterium]